MPFSAFWLRSSVVSVLIRLISDMWVNDSHDIKLLFWREESNTIACYWDSQVLPKCCTIAWAWHALKFSLSFSSFSFPFAILSYNCELNQMTIGYILNVMHLRLLKPKSKLKLETILQVYTIFNWIPHGKDLSE